MILSSTCSNVLILTWIAVVRMLFDLSSDFNAIIPVLLTEKLLKVGFSSFIVSWIADYVSERRQFA